MSNEKHEGQQFDGCRSDRERECYIAGHKRGSSETLERLLLFIGANPGEDINNAIIRYTAAVRLGCARALERRAEEVNTSTAAVLMGAVERFDPKVVSAALVGGGALLRQDLPGYEGEQNAEQVADAITRWKTETADAMAEEWIEHVLPEWWHVVMGDLPSPAAKDTLRELLLKYRPMDLHAPTVKVQARGDVLIMNGHGIHAPTVAQESADGPSLDAPDYDPSADELDGGDADGDDPTRQ